VPIFETPRQRILFIHIPKTGGTSIQNWLSQYVDMGFSATMAPTTLKTCPQHMGMGDLRVLMGTLKWDWAFAIVRDPYDRMESEYFFRTSIYKNPTGHLPDFSTWVLHHLRKTDTNPFQLDNHLRPQTDLLDSDVRVFRFEAGLKPVVHELSKRFGLEAPAEIDQANASQRKPVHWSLEALNAFNDFYHNDFKQLNYPCKTRQLDILSP
jgi:hypothetical protein